MACRAQLTAAWMRIPVSNTGHHHIIHSHHSLHPYCGIAGLQPQEGSWAGSHHELRTDDAAGVKGEK